MINSAPLASTLKLKNGHVMQNRFMLAPLTNLQSHADGVLSDEEYKWLTMRAEGGFGLTMTCAAAVSLNGRCWPGQLGVFDDKHIEGLARLASGIKQHDSLAIVQLHHGGFRAEHDITDEDIVSASDVEKYNARAMTIAEIDAVIGDFVAAAKRCQKAGFDGVELHGAHGYLIAQFLSPKTNQRDDHYGGSVENRERLLHTLIDEVRKACGPDFTLGLRLSAERFGISMQETLALAERVLTEDKIDFLDMSLWDCFKIPEEEDYNEKSLIEWYTALPRSKVALGISGKVRTPADALKTIELGADFTIIGRGAILNHDFANKALTDAAFEGRTLPVSAATLAEEGLSEVFINYMRTWAGFVSD